MRKVKLNKYFISTVCQQYIKLLIQYVNDILTRTTINITVVTLSRNIVRITASLLENR